MSPAISEAALPDLFAGRIIATSARLSYIEPTSSAAVLARRYRRPLPLRLEGGQLSVRWRAAAK